MPLTRLVMEAVNHTAQTLSKTTTVSHVLIVGTGARGQHAADLLLDANNEATSVVGFLDASRHGLWRYRDIPLLGKPDTLAHLMHDQQIDAVVLAPEEEEKGTLASLGQIARQLGLAVIDMPSIPSVASRLSPTDTVELSTLAYQPDPNHRVALFFKRIIDIVGSLIMLTLAAPVILVTAVLIKIDSHGPVLFSQERVGYNGKLFRLFKFRTMRNGAEQSKAALLKDNEMSGPVFKIKRDPRVTKLGRFLRKYSIDEMPQLFNILRGEMSLVGPRPPLPTEARQFQPWQLRKFSAVPGLTCIWQVAGRNSVDFEDWVRLDLEYIDHWSLWLDFKLMLRTIPAIVNGTGH